FSLCLTAAIIFNYYIAFMVCIFCALYFVCGAIVRSLSAREFFSRGLHFLAGALCAGASSAALLVPTLFIVNETKGSIFSLDFSLSANFNLAELFSRMFVGNFRWDDIQSGLPNIYCGMICVVFAVMFFFTRKIKLREKLAYGSLLMILTMSFWIDGLNLIWHGFKAPMWFPYRYSFIFSFVVIILASKALERFELTRFSAGATGLFLVGIFAAVCLFRGPALSVKRIAFAFICCAAAALLVCFAYRLKNKNLRLCAQALCAVAVASELVINSVFIMGTFEKADTSVFRMENTNFRTLNDPLLLGYNGTSFFCSTQDSRVTRVMNRLGYVNYGESNTYAYGSTAAADSLLSVKYLMSDGTGRP
ncbi:MAG: YfhO family protein, partial [Oscillospiraceae bacterium]